MSVINQTDVLLDLSYLLGESSIPTSGIDDRKAFIQRGLQRIVRLYDFDEMYALATVSLTLGSNSFYSGALPADAAESPDLDVRVINPGTNDDYVFEKVPYEDQDKAVTGDYKYWLTGSANDYTMTTRDDVSNVVVRYLQSAPTINASISTTFPSSIVIARAALVYYRQAENPMADIAQDEALFKTELEEVIARQNRNRPVGRAKSIMELNDVYSGSVEAW
jgi:hypothetical protein